MSNSFNILKIYPETFIANSYTVKPFRVIGLIDVKIEYDYGKEIVTLPYYRSSGTNGGKIEGVWYPIAGIKVVDGIFIEFTPYINYALTKTTKDGEARRKWLAKSIFFRKNHEQTEYRLRGFGTKGNYNQLRWLSKELTNLYENGEFKEVESLNYKRYNKKILSNKIYKGNNYSQRENFDKFIRCIYKA